MIEDRQYYHLHSKEEDSLKFDLPTFTEMLQEWLKAEWVDPDLPPMPFNLYFCDDSKGSFFLDSEDLSISQTIELWKPDPEKVYFRNGVVMNVIKQHNAEVWKSLDRGISSVEELLKGVPEEKVMRTQINVSPILNTVENNGNSINSEQMVKVFTLYMGLPIGYVRYMLDKRMQKMRSDPRFQEIKNKMQNLYEELEDQRLKIIEDLDRLGINPVHTHRGNFCVHFKPTEKEDIFNDQAGNARTGERRNFDPKSYFNKKYVPEVRLIDFDLSRIDMSRIDELVKETGIEVDKEIIETLIDSEDVYIRAVGLMAINNQHKKELNSKNTDYWQGKIMQKAMDEEENPELREAALQIMKKFTSWTEKTWRNIQALLQTPMLFLLTGLLKNRKWPQFIKDELNRIAQKKDKNASFVRVFLAYREKE